MKHSFAKTPRSKIPLTAKRVTHAILSFSLLVSLSRAYSQQAGGAVSTAQAPVTATDQLRQQFEQQQRAKLNAMLAERAQEDEAAKQRREEANAKTKQHVEDAKKKKAQKK